MPLLTIKGLSKFFGGLRANEEVSLDVETGQIVGVIGPNGAGKTTLFACISGCEKPTAGEVWFNGQNITGMSPSDICQLGMVRTFQIVRLFQGMTVLENVLVGGYLRTGVTRVAAEAALEALQFVGLANVIHVPAGNLTLAQKKRMQVARALATKPTLILLDEVMAGLNPTERQEAVRLVRRIRDRGITCLMVEHAMDIIMPLSDRVVVLNYGKKIAEGTAAEVSANEQVIKAYLGAKFSARVTGR